MVRRGLGGLLALAVAMFALVAAPPGAAALELACDQVVTVDIDAVDLELVPDLVGSEAAPEVAAAGDGSRAAVQLANAGVTQVRGIDGARLHPQHEPAGRHHALDPPLHRRGLR